MRRDTVSEESDEQLVARVQADRHDPRPFEVLVKRHQGFVLANCRIISRSPADAEDLAQEVFVKAYFGLRTFEQRAQFQSWLRQIKVNHVLNFLRKNRGKNNIDLDAALTTDSEELSVPAEADTVLESDDDRKMIVDVLDTLTETLRVPLLLRDADGMSYEDISKQLGIGLSAVKMRIKRGREEFRRRYEAAKSGVPSSDVNSTASE
ncbi:MAG: sigma-70 family RNA polymerase sigma factor [Gemmatimonadaceae bacterium]|nr:sigma-70 family RNA polymerase sigma factor [Gemmatimonadaceae bacterium]